MYSIKTQLLPISNGQRVSADTEIWDRLGTAVAVYKSVEIIDLRGIFAPQKTLRWP